MILISHRGNINGKNSDLENNPEYIDSALLKGYDVEVDVWYQDSQIWLGHDSPEYPIDLEYFVSRSDKIWIHCKNVDCLYYFRNCGYEINFFWHQTDDVTITSKGYFWTFPGKQLTNNSIAVMPEIKEFENIIKSFGICSDYIEKYNKI